MIVALSRIVDIRQGALSRCCARPIPAPSSSCRSLFALFVLFLYGPTLTIMVLSFQGLTGGLIFPMQGVCAALVRATCSSRSRSATSAAASSARSGSGLIVMVLTVDARRSWPASPSASASPAPTALFYLAVASLIMPSIVVSLGIGALFELLGIERTWWSSGLGAHLTWTLPFGLLIMFAVFNRFDQRFEEAARDLGATPVQTVRHVVLPIVLPSLIGVALFGFTLSYDELARSSQALGALNTLPLELQAMKTNVTTPVIYALGTLTTALSLVVIGTSLGIALWLRARQAKKGSRRRQGHGLSGPTAVAGCRPGSPRARTCRLVTPDHGMQPRFRHVI